MKTPKNASWEPGRTGAKIGKKNRNFYVNQGDQGKDRVIFAEFCSIPAREDSTGKGILVCQDHGKSRQF